MLAQLSQADVVAEEQTQEPLSHVLPTLQSEVVEHVSWVCVTGREELREDG